jgi:hypothetical protein
MGPSLTVFLPLNLFHCHRPFHHHTECMTDSLITILQHASHTVCIVDRVVSIVDPSPTFIHHEFTPPLLCFFYTHMNLYAQLTFMRDLRPANVVCAFEIRDAAKLASSDFNQMANNSHLSKACTGVATPPGSLLFEEPLVGKKGRWHQHREKKRRLHQHLHCFALCTNAH